MQEEAGPCGRARSLYFTQKEGFFLPDNSPADKQQKH